MNTIHPRPIGPFAITARRRCAPAATMRVIVSLTILAGMPFAWPPDVVAVPKSRPAAKAAPVMSPQAADLEVARRTAAAPTPEARVDLLARMAFIDAGEDPAIRQVARDSLAGTFPPLVVERTTRIADQLEPEGLIALLDLFDSIYPNLKGHSFQMNHVIATATGSPDRAVRSRASALVARYRLIEAYFELRKRCNRSHGEDRIEAIRTIGELGDGRAAWFLPEILDSSEPGVREAVYKALSKLGRAGTLPLKERLVDPDPGQRLLALEALMPLAEVDDLPSLYAFAQANPGMDERIKSDLYSLIARLEVIRDSGIETPVP